MTEKLGDHLARLSKDAREAWASGLFAALDMHDDLMDKVCEALDLLGWKIVSKDEDDSTLWPFDPKRTGCPLPDWCFDISGITDETKFYTKEAWDARNKPPDEINGHPGDN